MLHVVCCVCGVCVACVCVACSVCVLCVFTVYVWCVFTWRVWVLQAKGGLPSPELLALPACVQLRVQALRSWGEEDGESGPITGREAAASQPLPPSGISSSL